MLRQVCSFVCRCRRRHRRRHRRHFAVSLLRWWSTCTCENAKTLCTHFTGMTLHRNQIIMQCLVNVPFETCRRKTMPWRWRTPIANALLVYKNVSICLVYVDFSSETFVLMWSNETSSGVKEKRFQRLTGHWFILCVCAEHAPSYSSKLYWCSFRMNSIRFAFHLMFVCLLW